MPDFEKLGEFYLGRCYDLERGEAQADLLLYDSKDLVTHAVCVGMTGSGKTGLCLSLIEEAAIDGIPALVIDPKGDLANLLLTFPQLRAEDFAPWVNAEDAHCQGQTVEEYAAQRVGRRHPSGRDTPGTAGRIPGNTAGTAEKIAYYGANRGTRLGPRPG